MSQIPDEILEEIGIYLPTQSLLSFALTARRFAAIVDRDAFWQVRLLRDFRARTPGDSKGLYKSYFEGKLWREDTSPRLIASIRSGHPVRAAKVADRVCMGDRDGSISIAEDNGSHNPGPLTPLAGWESQPGGLCRGLCVNHDLNQMVASVAASGGRVTHIDITTLTSLRVYDVLTRPAELCFDGNELFLAHSKGITAWDAIRCDDQRCGRGHRRARHQTTSTNDGCRHEHAHLVI